MQCFFLSPPNLLLNIIQGCLHNPAAKSKKKKQAQAPEEGPLLVSGVPDLCENSRWWSVMTVEQQRSGQRATAATHDTSQPIYL